ncbi:MAG TPA: ATP-binding protein [Candidatus Sulfotelmatobacter sp.]|nr:ATP-binding protein [Candidatus Sulfotelmatobacter sp.]
MKPSTASLRDLCLNHFQVLRIPITPNDLDAVLERADQQSLSHLKFLDLLLGQQAAARRDRSIERRVREAQFEERKLLETFDWKFNPQIDRLQIEELATGDFIRRQSNLIVIRLLRRLPYALPVELAFIPINRSALKDGHGYLPLSLLFRAVLLGCRWWNFFWRSLLACVRQTSERQ